MPHGVLFRGEREAQIRQCLLGRICWRRSWRCPANLFYSTNIPACILIFRKDKPGERSGHVLFVDGSQRFVKGRNQNTMSEDDILAIAEGYRTGKDPDGEGGVQVRLVPSTEIADKGHDLNITRYISTSSDEAVDVAAALELLRESQEELHAAEREMWQRLTEARYG